MEISQSVSELCSGHETMTGGHTGGLTDGRTVGQGDYQTASADFVRQVPDKIKTQSLSFIQNI